ncbi:MAG: Serine/threonine kinase [Myxococcaceae bacterium]|nr:Serine/threonine kinase [Myxococcaceae bacterium]
MPYVADEFTGRTFGKYEVLCRMTVGGMAEIFLAFARTGPFAYKPVVLKRILSEHREDESSMQMLIDEAKITATLNHENVARVLDLEIAGEEVLLVIEFISGATLDELIHVVLEKKEVVPLGFVVTAIRDCAQGLHHAHSHKDSAGKPLPIIHRDVTPKNLMVDFEGVGKVLDFGIARAMGAARRTVAGMVRGTSAYMSPEQAIDGKMDIRTDIFSLGTIFHELLTGQRLFYRGNAGKEMAAVYEAEVPPPSSINRRVPKALDAVVLKALERPLTKRYQSGLEFVRDLSLAASSTAWSAERCAELVRNRFSRRREEVLALLPLMEQQDPEISASSTMPGRPTFHGRPQQVTTQRNTTPPRIPTATAQAQLGDDNTDENRRTDDAAVPTKFFTPNFATPHAGNAPSSRPSPPPMVTEKASIRPIGVVPELSSTYDEPNPTHVNDSTMMMLAPEPPTGPSVARPLTRTEPGAPRRRTPSGTSGFGVVLAAVGALAVGAIGGVVIHKSMGGGGNAGNTAQGLGRFSLDTDRAAEVQLGPNMVARTPVVDVWMSAGRHQFKVREPNGQWLALDVDVKPDAPTKLKVSLDTLQPVP